MSPLQRIAMGLLIVFIPAMFEIGGEPWDALPDPLGWLLVVSGVRALPRALDLELVRGLAGVALVVSVPLWFPQFIDVLPHTTDGGDEVVEPSVQWALFVPQALFSLLLARAVSRTAAQQAPRDVYAAGRFGVLTWAFTACIALPPIAYGAQVEALEDPTLYLIALVNLVFVYYLFRLHRREWLGGPGPWEVRPTPGGGATTKKPASENDEGRPPSL
jgi:hypothetical protein